MKKNSGGSAFPNGDDPGMTLRQWYAGQAVIGVINRMVQDDDPPTVAKAAFVIADAMIEAENNEK